MATIETIDTLRGKYRTLHPFLSERARRLWAASEAATLGWGGVAAVAEATGISRKTIKLGISKLEAIKEGRLDDLPPVRSRRPGGGRPRLSKADRTLVHDLEQLVEPTTRGDPESPLRWTCKSTRKLAAALGSQGHQVSHDTVATLLGELGYSLQANRKTREGKQHPDRDAQFQYINRKVRRFQSDKQPVVSVDTKKKELVGDYKNSGREWNPPGSPERVRTHDFPDKELGKVIPYGVYDLTANEGWVSVGIDHDTSQFACETLRRWWRRMGSRTYPHATRLLITADSGGSNANRSRLWRLSLQQLADQTGLMIVVCHFPPGTSKWNKIEHRMFCHISENWRGRPLASRSVVVSLIGSTKTRTGLRVRAELDANSYETGIKVSDEELAKVRLRKDRFHGNWNYSIAPSNG